MILQKKYFIYLIFLIMGFLIMTSPSSLLADEADSESASEEVVDEKENGKDAKMKKCMKEAKTSKEKKDCAEQNQKTVEEFIELNLVRDSILDANNATLTWEPQYALSVDIDPTRGGEHVNMMYLGTYIEGEEESQFNANLWFFVQDGKIITVNQYNQAIVNEDKNAE